MTTLIAINSIRHQNKQQNSQYFISTNDESCARQSMLSFMRITLVCHLTVTGCAGLWMLEHDTHARALFVIFMTFDGFDLVVRFHSARRPIFQHLFFATFVMCHNLLCVDVFSHCSSVGAHASFNTWNTPFYDMNLESRETWRQWWWWWRHDCYIWNQKWRR